MSGLELICLLIVLSYVYARCGRGAERKIFVSRFIFIACAAWMAEDSCISLYAFYQYSASWKLFVHHVPLLVVLIWPVVILSTLDIVKAASRKSGSRSLWVGLVVLTDALLIEPICASTRLWSWNEPGLFGVPLIGILGWALFAGACNWSIELFEKKERPWALFWGIGLGPVLCHLLLCVSWWGLFRWINVEVSIVPTIGLMWVSTALITLLLWRLQIGTRIPVRWVLLRAPAAGFFFGLLWWKGGETALWLYSLTFLPPYLVMMSQHKAEE